MDALITGEAERIGLSVIDNNDVEHLIEMSPNGVIEAHVCEEYANNPSLRTREECEYGDQARRFARWHVYRERGYDTVPPTENPDRLTAAFLAITALSTEEFGNFFGDIEERLESHYDGSGTDLPFSDADPADAIVYQKDIYLEPEPDPVSFDPPVLDQFLGRFEGEPDSPTVAAEGTIAREEMDALDFAIEAVSETHVLHNDGQGNEQVARGAQSLEREPDARVELMAFDPSSVDSFQHYVVSHLAYQIRDRFLLMGVKPPVAFRAQGWGTYEGFQCQKFCEFYEDYWSSEATVSSWVPA